MRPWVGLLGVPVGGGPPARSPHASLTARSGRSRSPARPRHRPRSPQPGPSVPPPPTAAAARPRLEAWPGPAGAHGRRSQAFRSRRRLLPPRPGPSVPPPPTVAAARLRLEAWPGPSGGDLKYQRMRPSSAPLVLSPVREIIRPVWLVACLCAKKFALQARKRRKTPFLGVLGELFRGSVVVWGVLGELFRGTAVERGRWESFVPGGLLVGACLESFVPGVVMGAVQSSPCWGSWGWMRYKVLPARAKLAEMGLLGRVGRVLYRLGCWCGCAGRVLYRRWCWVRYKVLPAGGRGGASGTKFSLLGQNGLKWAILGVLGEFCTGWAAGVGVRGEFCTGWAAGVGVLGEFCTGDTAEATHDERLSVRSQSL